MKTLFFTHQRMMTFLNNHKPSLSIINDLRRRHVTCERTRQGPYSHHFSSPIGCGRRVTQTCDHSCFPIQNLTALPARMSANDRPWFGWFRFERRGPLLESGALFMDQLFMCFEYSLHVMLVQHLIKFHSVFWRPLRFFDYLLYLNMMINLPKICHFCAFTCFTTYFRTTFLEFLKLEHRNYISASASWKISFKIY